jgi:hypothetical protein
MTTHAYSSESLMGDYGRAALGFGLVTVPLVTVELGRWVMLILMALAALFLVFGARTAKRQLSPIQLDDNGITAAGPFPARLEWSALERVKLGYYATKRDGSNGWMQLVLKGPGQHITVDSRIEGFEAIARAAAHAALDRGIEITPTTAANFGALGIVLEGRR